MTNVISDEMARCARCGTCRSVCPVFKEMLDETLVARGRIALFDSLVKGDVPTSARARRAIDTCLMCLKCRGKCPSLVATDEIFINARQWFNEKQGLPLLLKFAFCFIIPYRRLYDMILRIADCGLRIYRRLTSTVNQRFIRHLPLVLAEPLHRLPPITTKPVLSRIPHSAFRIPDSPRVAIFVGCLINYVYPEIYNATTRLLARSGVSCVTPPGQLCCGTPLLLYGDRQNAHRLAIRNLKVLTHDKPDAIITMCASCGRMLKEEYPKLGIGNWNLEFPIMDIMEYLNKYSIRNQKSEIRNLKVAYHHPCHFTWTESGEITRRILENISDYIQTDDEELCCGGGGSFAFSAPLISSRIGQHKILSYEESGVDAVVTNCPGCLMQLKYLISHNGQPRLKAYHIVELLERMAGISHGVK